jgi:diguanylate cyclase (GGDEF)-like protein
MTGSNSVRRFASAGLILVLLALTALSLVGVARTKHSSDVVARSRALADAYLAANRAVARIESIEREYRVKPSAAVRLHHAEAGADLNVALTRVQNIGDDGDHRLVQRLRNLFDTYTYEVLEVFAAVDNENVVEANLLDEQKLEPTFTTISGLVRQAADAHTRTADNALAELRRVENYVFGAMVGGFALGIGLAATMIGLVGRYQKALLRQAESHEYAALHDPLTGLPNRTLFADRLGQALSGRSHTPLAVMLLDLDRFKEVNDTFGHQYGDQLLQQVAARVDDVLRAGDTVARLAGDEFAVLLPDTDLGSAREVADRIRDRLHRSFALDGVTVDVEASIGVAGAPMHGATVEELMRCADLAMYTAKDAKTGAVVYEPATAARQPNRLVLLGDLRRALEQPDELVLYYQPKVSLPGGELCGVEALVRWAHPTRGLVPPGEFIPIAENTGLVNLLTTHVLHLAVKQAATWLADGLRVPIAVNLSARCLLDTTLLDRVRTLLAVHQLPAGLLRLEVTESAVMANPALAERTLTGLHKLGVRISIDDYGTGYSSMAYLKRLPVDELKVDRSFVANMTEAGNDDAILVRSAIDLGHNLGLTVVAEGVERHDHVAALRSLGCDVAQGFHYARPMPAADLLTWVHANEPTKV